MTTRRPAQPGRGRGVTLYLREEEEQRLRAAAEAAGMSPSAFVARWLRGLPLQSAKRKGTR